MVRSKRSGPGPDDLTVEDFRRARSGDPEAVERVVMANQGLLHSVAKRMLVPGFDSREEYEEMISAGQIGLLRAIKKYDPECSKFSTYAIHWIRKEMKDVRHEAMCGIVRVPLYLIKDLTTLLSEGEEFALQQCERKSSVERAKEAARTRNIKCFHAVDVESEASSAGPHDEQARIVSSHVIDVLRQHFSDRDFSIFVLRFGLMGCEPLMLREIGTMFGVTKESIRQRVDHMLRFLREHFAEEEAGEGQ